MNSVCHFGLARIGPRRNFREKYKTQYRLDELDRSSRFGCDGMAFVTKHGSTNGHGCIEHMVYESLNSTWLLFPSLLLDIETELSRNAAECSECFSRSPMVRGDWKPMQKRDE
jgi:hypothetical protein